MYMYANRKMLVSLVSRHVSSIKRDQNNQHFSQLLIFFKETTVYNKELKNCQILVKCSWLVWCRVSSQPRDFSETFRIYRQTHWASRPKSLSQIQDVSSLALYHRRIPTRMYTSWNLYNKELKNCQILVKCPWLVWRGVSSRPCQETLQKPYLYNKELKIVKYLWNVCGSKGLWRVSGPRWNAASD